MESGITLQIHHGGVFTEENGVKYYKSGKVEPLYNQSSLSLPVLENFICIDLGYKEFKIYWHTSGTLLNDYNCKLLWNDDGVEQLCYHAMKNGNINLNINHACETEEIYEFFGEDDSDSGRESGEWRE